MLGEGLQRVIPMPPVLGGQHPLKSAAELASEAMKSFPHKGAGSFFLHGSASFHNQYQ